MGDSHAPVGIPPWNSFVLLKNDSALEGDIQLLELNESWSPLEAVMAQSSNDQNLPQEKRGCEWGWCHQCHMPPEFYRTLISAGCHVKYFEY